MTKSLIIEILGVAALTLAIGIATDHYHQTHHHLTEANDTAKKATETMPAPDASATNPAQATVPMPAQVSYANEQKEKSDFIDRMVAKAKDKKWNRNYTEGFCDALRALGDASDDSQLTFRDTTGKTVVTYDCKTAIRLRPAQPVVK